MDHDLLIPDIAAIINDEEQHPVSHFSHINGFLQVTFELDVVFGIKRFSGNIDDLQVDGFLLPGKQLNNKLSFIRIREHADLNDLFIFIYARTVNEGDFLR